MRGFATIAGASGCRHPICSVSIGDAVKRFECIAAPAALSQDHLRIIDRRLRAVDELLTRLARDVGVTKRFIEVRLLRYGFLGQARAVA